MTTLIYFAVLWACLALTVAGLALYRKFVANHEDDFIHVGEAEANLIPKQIEVANKLDFIDRWGKLLTVIVAVTGAILAAIYLYLLYQESLKLVG